ncbi:MAG: phosphatase PAP2 family protein [Phormidesmis sp.]
MAYQSKTVIPQGIRAIAQRFWQDSKSLPPSAWDKWWKTLAIGLGLCALVTYGLTRIAMGWEPLWLQAWDEKWLLAWRDHSPLTFAKGVTWESPGNLVGMLPIFFTLTALTAWFRKPLIAATVVVTYLGQFALVWISWGMWSRARPDLIADGLAAPSLHSFPSGHVVVSVSMYGLIFYLWFRTSKNWLEKIIAIAFGTVWISLIALARLALGAHWPSDVIAGILIGSLWLTTVITALARAINAATEYKLKHH